MIKAALHLQVALRNWEHSVIVVQSLSSVTLLTKKALQKFISGLQIESASAPPYSNRKQLYLFMLLSCMHLMCLCALFMCVSNVLVLVCVSCACESFLTCVSCACVLVLLCVSHVPVSPFLCVSHVLVFLCLCICVLFSCVHVCVSCLVNVCASYVVVSHVLVSLFLCVSCACVLVFVCLSFVCLMCLCTCACACVCLICF